MSDIKNYHLFLKRAGLDSKAYQEDGVRWCLHNEINGNQIGEKVYRGGLLADEMGLGKTIQMIGTVLCNLKPRTLIVMPRVLIEQWTSILYKMTGHQALVYHGAGKDVEIKVLKSSPIVITTYGMVREGKHKKSLGLLHKIQWSRIICDEAHHLRNTKTSNHKGVLSLKRDITWIVTGTPIQNRKSDFYALCAIMGLPASYYTAPKNLNTIVRTFMLKRTKKGVGMELKDFDIKKIEVEWESKNEKSIAEDIHSMLQFSRVDKVNIDNIIASMNISTLPLLVRARQACVYPPLIAKQVTRLMEAGLIDDDEGIHDGLAGKSKINKVINTIYSNKNNGHKKLVFCHYRGEIDILETELHGKDMDVVTFDGRVSENKRHAILNSDCDVLIVQIQTGCEGLNLQQFSEIYFVSPHWNPAIEDQAIARCHRMGQQKTVTVYRFNMVGFDEGMETRTLDEYSTAVQEVKRSIMNELE